MRSNRGQAGACGVVAPPSPPGFEMFQMQLSYSVLLEPGRTTAGFDISPAQGMQRLKCKQQQQKTLVCILNLPRHGHLQVNYSSHTCNRWQDGLHKPDSEAASAPKKSVLVPDPVTSITLVRVR